MIYFMWALFMILSWFLPWWWVALPLVWMGSRAKSYQQALLWGVFSLAPVWVALAYYWDLKSYGLISSRIAGLFYLPYGFLSFVMVGLLAILLGVSASFTGYLFHKVYLQEKGVNHG